MTTTQKLTTASPVGPLTGNMPQMSPGSYFLALVSSSVRYFQDPWQDQANF